MPTQKLTFRAPFTQAIQLGPPVSFQAELMCPLPSYPPKTDGCETYSPSVWWIGWKRTGGLFLSDCLIDESVHVHSA